MYPLYVTITPHSDSLKDALCQLIHVLALAVVLKKKAQYSSIYYHPVVMISSLEICCGLLEFYFKK